MRNRVENLWSELVARRGGADLLLDLWLLTVILAVAIGFAAGWVSRG